MLPQAWTSAIYQHGSLYDAIEQMIMILHTAVWTSCPDVTIGGVAYTGTHAFGETREFYSGSCNLFVQNGRARGFAPALGDRVR